MAPKKHHAKGKGKAGAKLHVGKGKVKAKAHAGKNKAKPGKAGAAKGKAKAANANKSDKKSEIKSAGLKFATGFKDMLKAGGKKMKDKMKSKGALLEEKMKAKGLEMREKMKTKGNEMRKRMKEKMHDKTIEMKKKMKDTSEDMRKKMREKGHELREMMKDGGKDVRAKMKAKGLEFTEEMKKKMKATGEVMKHTSEDMEKRMMGAGLDVKSKLELWRKPFEGKGWTRGKAANDWATLMLLGLNAFSAVMSIPVLGVTIWMAGKFKKECLTFLLTPAVTIGFLFSISLLLLSAAGFFGVWFNRLNVVKFHFFLTAVLVLMLFVFTVFGFAVTSRGGGKKLPGIEFRKYNLTDYSKWLQRKVSANGTHWKDIKGCISKGSFCKGWNYASATDVYSAKLSPIQSGCCIPPFVCSFAYEGPNPTKWGLATHPEEDKDCWAWTDEEMCLNCDACRAGILQNVKSRWYKASIVSVVMIAALGTILYRTWYVMRVAGRWDSITETVKEVVQPKPEEKHEEQSVIDILEEKKPTDSQDEDVLFPSWLEEETPADAISKSSKVETPSEEEPSEAPKGTASKKPSKAKTAKQQKASKAQKELKFETPSEPPEASSTDSEAAGSTSSSKQSRKHGKHGVHVHRHKAHKHKKAQSREDDSWASPRQRMDPSLGYFPEGFLAQNPLTMSPWMQSPTAVYMQEGQNPNDPNYMQAYLQGSQGFLDYGQAQFPPEYMQGYYQGNQADPYGQMAGYTQGLQGYNQDYMASTGGSPQMYMQDPQNFQGYMQQDFQTAQQGPQNLQGYMQQDFQNAQQGPQNLQGYMQQDFQNAQQGPQNLQGYMQQDPQNFQGYMQQDPQNPQGYMQDPHNFQGYIQQDPQNPQGYMQDPQNFQGYMQQDPQSLNQAYMQQGYVQDPNQNPTQAYMQDPNQGYMQDPNQAYAQQGFNQQNPSQY